VLDNVMCQSHHTVCRLKQYSVGVGVKGKSEFIPITVGISGARAGDLVHGVDGTSGVTTCLRHSLNQTASYLSQMHSKR